MKAARLFCSTLIHTYIYQQHLKTCIENQIQQLKNIKLSNFVYTKNAVCTVGFGFRKREKCRRRSIHLRSFYCRFSHIYVKQYYCYVCYKSKLY